MLQALMMLKNLIGQPEQPIDYVSFQTTADQKPLRRWILWMAVGMSFAIANLPPARISPVLTEMLHVVPAPLAAKVFRQHDLAQISNQLVTLVVIPLKKLFFFLSLVVLCVPILKSLSRSKSFWTKLGVKRTAIAAFLLFLLLAVLTFPYGYPLGFHSHPSGLSGMGVEFGRMSMAPFDQYDDIFSKRLLKPAIAHYLHMDGHVRYYLFSLLCTYVLIFLIIAFLESKRLGHDVELERPFERRARWLFYLSLMTSSFVMTGFQSPGFSEHLSFILVLLMASIPMSGQARLACLALCLLNHDASALTLIPVIMFCFPPKERVSAFALFGLFYGAVLAGYGFSLQKGLQGQGSMLQEGSVWERAIGNLGFFVMGIFFSYKLLWFVLPLAVWMLWKRNKNVAAFSVALITLFPISLCLVAWDTTRVAAFGWLGMLIAFSLLISELRNAQASYQYGFVALSAVSLLIPSYNGILYYSDSLSAYRHPGLYWLIDSFVRSAFT